MHGKWCVDNERIILVSYYDVIDDFLSESDMDNFYETFTHGGFPWTLLTKVNENAEENDFQFAHKYIDNGEEVYATAIEALRPIFRELYHAKYMSKDTEVYRAKTNLFIKTDTGRGLGFHHDITNLGDNYKTIIYYVNSNNGGTRFEDNTFVGSVRNRALLFNGKIAHETVTQTDTNFRFNININYNSSSTPLVKEDLNES